MFACGWMDIIFRPTLPLLQRLFGMSSCVPMLVWYIQWKLLAKSRRPNWLGRKMGKLLPKTKSGESPEYVLAPGWGCFDLCHGIRSPSPKQSIRECKQNQMWWTAIKWEIDGIKSLLIRTLASFLTIYIYICVCVCVCSCPTLLHQRRYDGS